MKPIKGNLKIQKTLKARMWHCFADPQRGTRSANHFQIDFYWSVTITVSSFITENNQCVKTRTIKPSMCVVNPFSSHLHIFRWHPPMHTLWIVSVDLSLSKASISRTISRFLRRWAPVINIESVQALAINNPSMKIPERIVSEISCLLFLSQDVNLKPCKMHLHLKSFHGGIEEYEMREE